MNMETVFKTIISAIGGILSFLWGECDVLLLTLLMFITLDIITGLIKALYKKELDSRKMARGIISKGFEMLIVLIGVRLDQMTGMNGTFRSFAIMYYVATEGLSILENTGEFIELPDWLKNFLTQLKQKANEGNETAEK